MTEPFKTPEPSDAAWYAAEKAMEGCPQDESPSRHAIAAGMAIDLPALCRSEVERALCEVEVRTERVTEGFKYRLQVEDYLAARFPEAAPECAHIYPVLDEPCVKCGAPYDIPADFPTPSAGEREYAGCAARSFRIHNGVLETRTIGEWESCVRYSDGFRCLYVGMHDPKNLRAAADALEEVCGAVNPNRGDPAITCTKPSGHTDSHRDRITGSQWFPTPSAGEGGNSPPAVTTYTLFHTCSTASTDPFCPACVAHEAVIAKRREVSAGETKQSPFGVSMEELVGARPEGERKQCDGEMRSFCQREMGHGGDHRFLMRTTSPCTACACERCENERTFVKALAVSASREVTRYSPAVVAAARKVVAGE